MAILKESWRDRYAVAGDLRLRYVDLRHGAARDPEGLERVLSDALEHLSYAGQGFGELVTSHLQTVVAMDRVTHGWAPGKSAWASNFQGMARTNGHFVACQLVWYATAIRLERDRKASGRALNKTAMRDACRAAQERYLRQFDDAEQWIRYMDPDANTEFDSNPGAA
jgi:hypothetical protein